ncbi:hypothetical protein BDN67DRAFT_629301 [Paxillus ammoniavirescens]|nr:hypothetical protein BDN67DRAFT_629301 [Paxillus ammoniavirescens]
MGRGDFAKEFPNYQRRLSGIVGVRDSDRSSAIPRFHGIHRELSCCPILGWKVLFSDEFQLAKSYLDWSTTELVPWVQLKLDKPLSCSVSAERRSLDLIPVISLLSERRRDCVIGMEHDIRYLVRIAKDRTSLTRHRDADRLGGLEKQGEFGVEVPR